MKHIVLFILFFLSLNAFSQNEMLDSIESIRLKNIPELAEEICTEGYWNAQTDGGKGTFQQICSWGDRIDLKLKKKQTNKDRAVLTVDMYMDEKHVDRIYLYLEKRNGNWFIDGLNEDTGHIKLFLEGAYSGNFSPTSLPEDNELKEFGENLLSNGRDEIGMILFLEENTTPDSEHDFTSQMTTDTNFEQHFVNDVGYEERTKLGFIHFMGKHIDEEDYYSSITIYVSKTESGKLKILDRVYTNPYSSHYFYLLTKQE